MLYDKQVKFKNLSSGVNENINKALENNKLKKDIQTNKNNVKNQLLQNQLDKLKKIDEIRGSNIFNNQLRETFETFKDSGAEELGKQLDKVKENFMHNTFDFNFKVNEYTNFLQKKNTFLNQAEAREKERVNSDYADSLNNQFQETHQETYDLYKNIFDKHGQVDVDSVLNLSKRQQEDINNINSALGADYLDINNNVVNNPLWDINKKNLEYKKGISDNKINSGIDWYEEIFDNDKRRAGQELNLWKMNPDTIRKNYNLSDDEYHSILNHMEKVYHPYESALKDLEKKRKDLTEEQKERGAGIIANLEQQFLTIENKENKEFFKENIDKGIDNLILTKEYMDAYKNDLGNTKYYNYNKRLGKVAQELIKSVDNSYWFNNTPIKASINFINKNFKYGDVGEKDKIKLDLLIELKKNNIQYDSSNKEDIKQARKVAENVLNNYFDLDPINHINDDYVKNKNIYINKSIEKNNIKVDNILNKLL